MRIGGRSDATRTSSILRHYLTSRLRSLERHKNRENRTVFYPEGRKTIISGLAVGLTLGDYTFPFWATPVLCPVIIYPSRLVEESPTRERGSCRTRGERNAPSRFSTAPRPASPCSVRPTASPEIIVFLPSG